MLKTLPLSDKKSGLKKSKREVKSQSKKVAISRETPPLRLVKSWEQFYKVAGDVLNPIANETEYLSRLELVDTLWDEAEGENDPRMALVRLVLTTIVEWEKIHEAPYVEGAAGHVVLKSLMDEHQITQSQLAQEGIMPQSLASKILLGKRSISKALAKKLAERFQVSPALFI